MNGRIPQTHADDWLQPVLELTDPIGVLSVYVDADPTLAAGTPPAWSAPVRSGLRALAKEARQDWPRDERFALEARLDGLQPELDSLFDPSGSTRGRAMFAGISGGGPVRVGFRVPLPSRVSCGDRAIVLPLLAARQEGRAAGVATVLWDRFELSEWELDELHELETVELETESDPGDRRPATNPAVPQPFPERDRYETGMGARIAARARETGEKLAGEADRRRWDYVIADGDPRLLDALEAGFGAGGKQLVRSPRPLSGATNAETADRVASILGELRSTQTAQLLARLESSSAATADTVVVERAFEEGRVEHLLLAHTPAPDHAASAESLVRRALDTGAEVTLVEPSLLDHTDAAALLRW